jgi:hypothetical protein
MPWSQDDDGIKTATLAAFSQPAIDGRIRGVVDLGAGAGLWRHHSATFPVGSLFPWIAVEVHTPNVARFKLRDRYDVVRNIDFRRIKFRHYPGHVFVFGDVLEHLQRDQAVDVVRRAAAVGTVAFVMPFHPTTSAEQGPVDGNEYETHRYIWRWEEFAEAVAPLQVQAIQEPPGHGRNKGAGIIWHPSHNPNG